MKYTEIASLGLSIITAIIVVTNWLSGSNQRLAVLIEKLEQSNAETRELNSTLKTTVHDLSGRVLVLEHRVDRLEK